MNISTRGAAIFFAIVLVSVLSIAPNSEAGTGSGERAYDPVMRPDQGTDIMSGEILIKLSEAAAGKADELPEYGLPRGIAGLDEFIKLSGVKEGYRVVREHGVPIGDMELFRSVGLDRLYLLVLPEEDPARIRAILWELKGKSWIEYAEPASAGNMHPLLVPNDPRYVEQYEHDNTGQTGGTVDADIDSPEAWDIETGDPGAIVAVIDSGATLDHEDLVDNIIAGYDFFYDDPEPEDLYGHGTHVSGHAVARGNNAKGISGVCWSCSLMPLKVISNDGEFTGWGTIADAIRYAADNGADVINMSIGEWNWSEAMTDAIDYAEGRGTLCVAAIGNEKRAESVFPALYSGVAAVGGTYHDDRRLFSYGDHLEVSAPSYGTMTTSEDGGYSIGSGTSSAAPHVAGLAALLRAYDPGLHVREIRHLLRLGADDQVGDTAEDTAGWDRFMGYGRINSHGSLSMVDGPWLDLDRPHYICTGEITVALKDKTASSSVDVGISGDIGGDSETVTVTPVTADGYYEGSIPISWAGKDGPVTPEDGSLDVTDGETVTASVDSLTATAFVSCLKEVCARPEIRMTIAGDCDDDGAADPGEVWKVGIPVVSRFTEPLPGAIVMIESDDPDVEILNDTAEYGTIYHRLMHEGAGYPESDGRDDRFRIRVHAGATANSSVTLRVTSISGHGWEPDDAYCTGSGLAPEFTIPTNRDLGAETERWDFDDGSVQGFTHSVSHGSGDLSECPAYSWEDQWTTWPVSDRSHSGAFAMRVGDGLSYTDDHDASLISPTFTVPAGGGAVGFYTWIDIHQPRRPPDYSQDGLVVEAKRTGDFSWTYLADGSYNVDQMEESCESISVRVPFGWEERVDMLAGDGDGTDMTGDTFDRQHLVSLNQFAGDTASVRFRFGSDTDEDTTGTGLWLDTIVIYPFTADNWPGTAPTGLSGSDAACPTSYDLSWDAVTGADGYNIYRSTSSCMDASNRPDTYGYSPTAGFSDTGAHPGVEYFYAVEALEAGAGCPTERSCITGGCPCDGLPDDPTGLLLDRIGDDILLTWNNPLVPGMTWNVYRDGSPDPSAWGAPRAAGVSDEDPATEGIQHTDTGAVSDGSPLYYLVTATDVCGESPLR